MCTCIQQKAATRAEHSNSPPVCLWFAQRGRSPWTAGQNQTYFRLSRLVTMEHSNAPVYSWSAKGYPLDSWQATCISKHLHQLSDIIKQSKGSLQTEGNSAPVYSWSAKGQPLDSWQAPS